MPYTLKPVVPIIGFKIPVKPLSAISPCILLFGDPTCIQSHCQATRFSSVIFLISDQLMSFNLSLRWKYYTLAIGKRISSCFVFGDFSL